MFGSRLIPPMAWLIAIFLANGHRVAAEDPIHFETEIRPIFKAMCFHCHGEEEEMAGHLDVRLVRLLLQGGDSGASVVPGNPDASLLWQRIASDEMPESPKKLTPAEKATIRRWIEAGAATLRAEPENVADARFTTEELQFWAFQPPVRPAIPFSGASGESPFSGDVHPIDAWIAAAHSPRGLAFSPEADRATLLRRLKLDLLGLPPTRDELQEFLTDPSENAYEKWVDRWLDSPQFGVRWARHWLDVAGYAESDGNVGKDREREHAWRYRDYVVDAFNRDKPYDAFLVEQLSGDECIDGPIDPDNPRHVELLAATGMLRMAPDVTATENTLLDRNQAVADVIKVVGSAVLGLSVGCAQCHDHRYDPITIEDYYRFRAIFDPAFPLQHWETPDRRLIDMTASDDRAVAASIEAEAICRDQELLWRKREVGKQIFQRNLEAVPEGDREALLLAVRTSTDQQTETQKKLLLSYPMVRPVEAIVGQLVEFDKINNNENYNRFEAQTKEIAAFRSTKPPQRLIMAVQDSWEHLPESAVFFRGDPEQPKSPVQPSELYVLARQRAIAPLPITGEEQRSRGGRRLAYARQITDGSHPLVARVAVNRLWQHHFGAGLVPTPGDFGVAGQRPTHPELLDWLASDLVEHGWKMKRMHKQIVMSRTYRQRSTRTSDLEERDPENRFYARASLRRMEAEVVRDAMLAVSGQLDTSLGGPSVSVAEDGEGRATIGRRLLKEGLFAGIEDVGAEKNRRSLFLQSRRSLPVHLLETFDLPAMNPNCDARRCSTVATQSLLFLNDQSIVQCSEALADLLLRESADETEQLHELFVRLFSQSPSDEERSQCEDFLNRQREHFRADANPARRALASLCQILMASNRFLYID